MGNLWKRPEAIPDFVDCPSHILVWNECNGTSEISVEPESVWEFREGRTAWRLWRDVPTPSNADIERAMKRAFERPTQPKSEGK